MCVKRCDNIFVAPFLYLEKVRIIAFVIGYIIKNDTCGDDCKGIEINPPMLRIVDTANQYHLWELPYGETVGIGFKEILVKIANTFNVIIH